MPREKRDVKELKQRAIHSLVLAIELFNRPHEDGRPEGTLILLHHAFEMLLKAIIKDNEKGYNRDWIERQLAHAERNGVRASYNHAEYLPERRKMMQDWADFLSELKEKARQEQAA